MTIRRLARQSALQFLYALQYDVEPFEVAEAQFLSTNPKQRKNWDEFSHELALRTFENREELDAEISKILEHWTIERISLIDRLCLRMALCEFREFPEIPLRVTLNEYIELARRFGTEESPQYINGVLDRLGQDYQHKDFAK